MSKPTQRDQVQKGLQHLKGSDKIIGDIVGYCVQAYKADSSPKTLEKIRKYVEDTANSVSEHVLTIAHNLNRIIDSEAKEIEELSFQTGYVAHRLKSHQRYMSELFMTKFQTFPRPRPTIHILRRAIPENQLPRYARRKRPWQRQTGFDYKILDQVGARTTGGGGGGGDNGGYNPNTSPRNPGTNQPTQPQSHFQPKAAVEPFNPYANPLDNKPGVAKISGNKPLSLFEQQKRGGMSNNAFMRDPNVPQHAPPAFGNQQQPVRNAEQGGGGGSGGPPNPPGGNVPPPIPNVAYVGGDDDGPRPPMPPIPNANGPGGGPPAVPSIPPMGGGGGPPPVPNFGAAFKPPQQAQQPPMPPVPNVAPGGGGPPIPPVPQIPPAAPGPPPPPPN